jgi:hypothetical protein
MCLILRLLVFLGRFMCERFKITVFITDLVILTNDGAYHSNCGGKELTPMGDVY